jgi:hypothetical protein
VKGGRVILPFEIPDELLDALADELEERLEERRRWANIEETAESIGLNVKQVRGLKERHPEIATRVGKRLVFDLWKVGEVLEQRRGHSA